MDDNLEDILAGVERDIRCAEERLRSHAHRSSCARSRAECWSSGRGRIDPLRWESNGCEKNPPPSTGDFGMNKATPHNKDLIRRLAWADLEKDGPPVSIGRTQDCSARKINNEKHDSLLGRAEFVNKLLQVRDAKVDSLCTLGEPITAAWSSEVSKARHHNNVGSIIQRSLDQKPKSAPDDTCIVSDYQNNEESPTNSQRIFFASDIQDSPGGKAMQAEVGKLNLKHLATGILGFEAEAGGRGESLAQMLATDALHQESNLCSLPQPNNREGDKEDIKPPVPRDDLALKTKGSLDLDIGGFYAQRSLATSMAERGKGKEGGVADEQCTASQEVRRSCERHWQRRKNASPAQLDKEPAARTGRCINVSAVHSGRRRCSKSKRRIQELAQDRQKLYSLRERQRQEMQEKAETEECTFHPKVKPHRARMAQTRRWPGESGEPRAPLYERLHREAKGKEAARLLAQHHIEVKLLKECTFQPVLTAISTVRSGQRPLHERVWEVERQRESNLRRLQADKEEREGGPFAPVPLGRISEKLARDLRSTAASFAEGEVAGIQTRGLMTAGAMRRRQRSEEQAKEEARASTLGPSISEGTRRLVRKRPELQVPFEERQAILEAKKLERSHLRLAKLAKEESQWFNPSTAKRTDSLLRRSKPHRLDETVQQRVARMTCAEDLRRQKFVDNQRAKERGECTFRPALNPVTQCIGQATPIDELVSNRRGERVRERARERARAADACTYKPSLIAEKALSRMHQEQDLEATRRVHRQNPHDHSGQRVTRGRTHNHEHRESGLAEQAATLYGPGNKYRLNTQEPGRMIAELRARERQQQDRIRLLREEREIGEMQSCTFEPRTNRGILRAAGPVLVRGLGRHLELRNVAEQQEIDRQEREARAFGVRPGAPRRTMLGETMLEPFTLSEGNCRGWWEARRRQHEAERAAQLTFKPWTLEGKRSGTLSEVPESPSILSEKTFVTSILDSAERPVSRNS